MTADNTSLVPAFVALQIGPRRIALPRARVAELIVSPLQYTFPHTTPLIMGVVMRRGRIFPVLDLGPGVTGEPSRSTRSFLIVERRIADVNEKCAIPIQGQCELVTGNMIAAEDRDGHVLGILNLNGERIEVVDLDKTIALGTANSAALISSAEASS